MLGAPPQGFNIPVPPIDSPDNSLINEVVGNKRDAAVIAVGLTASEIAYLKGILNVVNSIAGGTYWQTFGPGNVQVTNAVTLGVSVFDPGGGIIPLADITPGTYTIDRIRLGVLTNIVGATPSSKTNGAVYVNYAFPGASWAIGDLFVITFTGIQVVISGVTTSFPPIQVWGRVVIEPDILSLVTTINTVQGAMADAATLDDLSDVTTTSAHAKLRRLLLRMSGAGIFSADIQGVARTELDTMLAQLATYISALGAAYSQTLNPGGAARTNIELCFRDIADMLAGTTGIVTFPAASAPGNGVSLAEVIHYISDALDALLTLAEAGGTLLSTALEQNVVINNAPAAVFKPLTVKIDLDNMVGGDTTVIRVYERITAAGALQQVDYQSYTGADGGLLDGNKVIIISLKENRYGFKVTLQQTAGGFCNYDYEYIYEA